MPDGMLGKLLTVTEYKAAYDAEAKRLLANKIVLAQILKGCVPEYRDCSVEDIERLYIEGEPHIGDVPVHRFTPGRTVQGMNTEDKTDSEGTQYYDIRFYASLPNSEEKIGLIINVEAQNRFHPGYALVRRGIYYCCRMLSAQYGEIFEKNHYEDLKKVYSIWICSHAPAQAAGTITSYRITEECNKGAYTGNPKDYDLLKVILVNFNDNDHSDGLNRFLKVLLSNTFSGEEKHQILTDEYHIKLTENLERGIDSMCNLSDGIWEAALKKGMKQGIEQGITEGIEKGIEQGIEQGIEKGIEQGIEKGIKKGIEQGIEKGVEKGRTKERTELIRNMFYQVHLPVEVIAQAAKTTVEDVRRILSETAEE